MPGVISMYVVDGYNLLHALARFPGVLPGDGDRARARMLELLSHLCRRESVRARVYFDGTVPQVAPGELADERVRVIFCGSDSESADREVRDYVEGANEPRKLKVVSSDIAVASACRLTGASIIRSDEMGRRLAAFVQAPANKKAQGGSGLEKPTRGVIGRLEQEMLDEIGDLKEFERRVLDGEA